MEEIERRISSQGLLETLGQGFDDEVTMGDGLNLTGHVFEGEDESGEVLFVFFVPEYRRHVDPQARSVGQGRQEAGGRSASSLFRRLLLVLKGLDDGLALQDPEDRPSQADPDTRPVFGQTFSSAGLEQFAGSLIVEQDLAGGVADQHSAGQFRHEGGKPVAFLVQLRAGCVDAFIDVELEFLEGFGGGIDDPGEVDDLFGAGSE